MLHDHHDVGITFVIAQRDVVTRAQAFNQIVFQQQRFGLVVCDRNFNVADVRQHRLCFGMFGRPLKITTHALL